MIATGAALSFLFEPGPNPGRAADYSGIPFRM